jgi:hypothetical protein
VVCCDGHPTSWVCDLPSGGNTILHSQRRLVGLEKISDFQVRSDNLHSRFPLFTSPIWEDFISTVDLEYLSFGVRTPEGSGGVIPPDETDKERFVRSDLLELVSFIWDVECTKMEKQEELRFKLLSKLGRRKIAEGKMGEAVQILSYAHQLGLHLVSLSLSVSLSLCLSVSLSLSLYPFVSLSLLPSLRVSLCFFHIPLYDCGRYVILGPNGLSQYQDAENQFTQHRVPLFLTYAYASCLWPEVDGDLANELVEESLSTSENYLSFLDEIKGQGDAAALERVRDDVITWRDRLQSLLEPTEPTATQDTPAPPMSPPPLTPKQLH